MVKNKRKLKRKNYGEKQKKTDVISSSVKGESKDFVESLKELKQEAGVDLKPAISEKTIFKLEKGINNDESDDESDNESDNELQVFKLEKGINNDESDEESDDELPVSDEEKETKTKNGKKKSDKR